MGRGIVLTFLGLLLSLGVTPAYPDSVPPSARGLWSDGACGPTDPYYMFNRHFVIIFMPQPNGSNYVFGPVEWASGTAVLTRPEGMMLLPPISGLQRCELLPGNYYAVFAETIALFRAYDGLVESCQDSTVQQCAEAIFRVADITGDGRLSVAELSRVLRGLGPLIAYEMAVSSRTEITDPGMRLQVGTPNLFGGTIIASITGRFVVDGLLRTYDYDGDGFLSLAEILQDRDTISVVSVGGAVAVPIAHATVVTALQALTAFGGISAGQLLGGIFR